MEPLEIVLHPNPILEKKTEIITDYKTALSLLKKMASFVKKPKNHALGLACPQVGESISGFVAKIDGKVMIFMNPEIIETEGYTESTEGCLSIPDVSGKVDRYTKVKVRYTNEREKTLERTFAGLNSIVVQHEIDHLNGILFTSKVNSSQKEKAI